MKRDKRSGKILSFYYYDQGMLTAFVLAQAMTEGMNQEQRDKYFDMMIETTENRMSKKQL